MANIKGFELVEPPYRGGMAMVYEGRRGNFRRAFKLLRPDKAANNPRLSEMFLREIQVQSQLSHPNIVTIIDAYQHEFDSGNRFTVLEMEWLTGCDLQSFIEKRNNGLGLDPATVKKIALQVIEGMIYAHNKNILHLDLKPSNLFRTVDGYIKIIDFGIAKVVGENADIVEGAQNVTMVTSSGENFFKGTLAFSAPEQQVGGKLSFATDIFSFGQTLHYLLTASTDPDVEVSDPMFRAVIDKCTQLKPRNRYQSFQEIKQELSDEPATKQCPNPSCGRHVDINFKYCPYCSTALDKPATPADTPPRKRLSTVCNQCKFENVLRPDGKTRFCMKCGALLTDIN